MADFLSPNTRSERVTGRWRRRFLPRLDESSEVRFFDLLIGSLLHNPPALAMLAASAVILGLFVQNAAYEARQIPLTNQNVVHPQAINPAILNLRNQGR